jgi:hypothetical protein
MPKRITIKNHLRAALIMGFFAALTIYITDKREEELPVWADSSPNISSASVQHDIYQDMSAEIQQLNGVKVRDSRTGKFVYYFEYIANKQDTLRRISAMPFLKDNRTSSLSVELMESSLNPLDGSTLSEEERTATSFFWNAKGEEFTFYECYKSPVKHTLLLSKTSDKILHKVEFI